MFSSRSSCVRLVALSSPVNLLILAFRFSRRVKVVISDGVIGSSSALPRASSIAARRLRSGMSTTASATALKKTGSTIPAADTETVFVPRFGPSVIVLSALPFSSVLVRVTLSVPLPAVTVNVTEIPSTAERVSSRTSMTNGFDRAVPEMPLWLSPETFESPGVIKLSVGVISALPVFFTL